MLKPFYSSVDAVVRGKLRRWLGLTGQLSFREARRDCWALVTGSQVTGLYCERNVYPPSDSIGYQCGKKEAEFDVQLSRVRDT